MQNVSELNDWLGKSQTREAIIDARQAELLAVTLDQEVPQAGEPLPACWQWAWFNDCVRADGLGRDGHPKRGGFLPPVELPRRMWAGGSIEMLAPLRVGETVKKVSTIDAIKERDGNSGKLCIVTVGHDYFEGGKLCVREKQNLVYREDPKPDAPLLEAPLSPVDAEVRREVTPDPVLMFRYSALTFNGHRIHYDVDYARDVEGYRDLVFHAPLTATMLCQLAGEIAGKPISKFEYRATSPLFCNETFTLCGKQDGNGVLVWAETPDGGQAMLANAIV